jgi:hypothetical protein
MNRAEKKKMKKNGVQKSQFQIVGVQNLIRNGCHLLGLICEKEKKLSTRIVDLNYARTAVARRQTRQQRVATLAEHPAAAHPSVNCGGGLSAPISAEASVTSPTTAPAQSTACPGIGSCLSAA